MMLATMGCMAAALILWRRAPVSSLLVVLASIVTILAFVVYPFAFAAAVRSIGSDSESVSRINSTFGFVWSLFRAAYLIVLAVAVYLGRRKV